MFILPSLKARFFLKIYKFYSRWPICWFSYHHSYRQHILVIPVHTFYRPLTLTNNSVFDPYFNISIPYLMVWNLIIPLTNFSLLLLESRIATGTRKVVKMSIYVHYKIHNLLGSVWLLRSENSKHTFKIWCSKWCFKISKICCQFYKRLKFKYKIRN